MKKNIGTSLLKLDGKFYIRTRNREIYEVNEIGARFYDLINGNNKVEDICKKLLAMYDIEETILLNDLDNFSKILFETGILEE